MRKDPDRQWTKEFLERKDLAFQLAVTRAILERTESCNIGVHKDISPLRVSHTRPKPVSFVSGCGSPAQECASSGGMEEE
jgi:hypothetical protein